MKFPIEKRFELTENFISKYKNVKPNFGFNGLGEFVFMRTYSRIKENGLNEQWWETVRRVVEGIYSIQWEHIDYYGLGWNGNKSQRSAQEMYDRIFNFKMLGSGRALWSLGTPVVMDKGLTESLFNCSFISTEDTTNLGKTFANIMDFLMLGVGVGLDVRGAENIVVREPFEKEHLYVIPDTREGWVKSLELVVNSYFGGKNYVFDYSKIRDAGEPIKTFGGVASGFEPLKKLHESVHRTLYSIVGEKITETAIADIANNIGVCVVSGNVRRSAEILLGDGTEEFLELKDYNKNPNRQAFGWASNNSVISNIGDDYRSASERIKATSEPGFLWLENFHKYGRMREDEADGRDYRIRGTNPCGEIGLEAGELCNLVEVIPSNHENLEDFKKTIKYAYLFAKTITLLKTNWEETNRVLLRNRRIGLSMTGIAQFKEKFGLVELGVWQDEGYKLIQKYDEIYSDWFAIPKSIKTTTVKPSGTLSLLAGVTAGVHYPQANYYIRRVRLSKNSNLIKPLKDAGYNIEPAFEDKEGTVVVEFPVSLPEEMRTIDDISMWEQIKLAEFCQKNWADNSVSVTVTFSEDESKDLLSAIEYAQFGLKAVSFLPKIDGGVYKQMPYETIDKETFQKMSDKIKPIDFSDMSGTQAVGEKYCETDVCEIKTEEENIILTKEINFGG